MDDLRNLAGLDVIYLYKGRLKGKNIGVVEGYVNSISTKINIVVCDPYRNL